MKTVLGKTERFPLSARFVYITKKKQTQSRYKYVNEGK